MTIDKSGFPAIRADISVTHHPDAAASKWGTALDVDGSSGQVALNAGVAALKALYTGTAQAKDARRSLAQYVKGQPVSTPKGVVLKTGHEREYAEGVTRIKASVLKVFDSYQQQVAGTCDRLSAAVAGALKDKSGTTPAVQAEIRAFIRSLPAKERLRFVMEQPIQAYAAVNAAPSFLSGLTDEQLAVMEANARTRFAPVEHAQEEAAHALFGHLVTVRTAFTAWADGEIAEGNTPSARAVAAVRSLGR